VFALYRLLADPVATEEMRANYLRGGYGYGHAKQALFERILEKFGEARARYDHLMANKQEIDEALAIGAAKARPIAQQVLKRVRNCVGY
jgi:tryptophanyl-tRNA synthetase